MTISKEVRLLHRVNKNFSDFKEELMMYSKQMLIEKADIIASTSTCHFYLTEQAHFSKEEIDYLLTFKNPLKVVADVYVDSINDKSEKRYSIDYIMENKDVFTKEYPLMKTVKTPERE